MTSDRVRLAESVLSTWGTLDRSERDVARALLRRIGDDPICGVPLADPVKGYWCASEERVRVIYRLVPQSGVVFVLRITRVGERISK